LIFFNISWFFYNVLIFFLFFFVQEFEENASVQIKGSRNPKNNEKKMKEIFKKLHAQRLFLKPNSRNALC